MHVPRVSESKAYICPFRIEHEPFVAHDSLCAYTDTQALSSHEVHGICMSLSVLVQLVCASMPANMKLSTSMFTHRGSIVGFPGLPWAHRLVLFAIQMFQIVPIRTCPRREVTHQLDFMHQNCHECNFTAYLPALNRVLLLQSVLHCAMVLEMLKFCNDQVCHNVRVVSGVCD